MEYFNRRTKWFFFQTIRCDLNKTRVVDDKVDCLYGVVFREKRTFPKTSIGEKYIDVVDTDDKRCRTK